MKIQQTTENQPSLFKRFFSRIGQMLSRFWNSFKNLFGTQPQAQTRTVSSKEELEAARRQAMKQVEAITRANFPGSSNTPKTEAEVTAEDKREEIAQKEKENQETHVAAKQAEEQRFAAEQEAYQKQSEQIEARRKAMDAQFAANPKEPIHQTTEPANEKTEYQKTLEELSKKKGDTSQAIKEAHQKEVDRLTKEKNEKLNAIAQEQAQQEKLAEQQRKKREALNAKLEADLKKLDKRFSKELDEIFNGSQPFFKPSNSTGRNMPLPQPLKGYRVVTQQEYEAAKSKHDALLAEVYEKLSSLSIPKEEHQLTRARHLALIEFRPQPNFPETWVEPTPQAFENRVKALLEDIKKEDAARDAELEAQMKDLEEKIEKMLSRSPEEALKEKKEEFAKQLNQDMNATNQNGYTLLMQMVKDGNLEMVEWIVTTYPEALFFQSPKTGSTALMHAAKSTHRNAPAILNVLFNALLKFEPAKIANFCDLRDKTEERATFLDYLYTNRMSISYKSLNISLFKESKNKVLEIYFEQNNAAMTQAGFADYSLFTNMIQANDLEMVRWILKSYPETLLIQEKENLHDTPLILLLRNIDSFYASNSLDLLKVMLSTLLTFDKEKIIAHCNLKNTRSQTLSTEIDSLRSSVLRGSHLDEEARGLLEEVSNIVKNTPQVSQTAAQKPGGLKWVENEVRYLDSFDREDSTVPPAPTQTPSKLPKSILKKK